MITKNQIIDDDYKDCVDAQFDSICDNFEESERKLSMAFDVVENALFVLSPEGRFLKANRAATELLGYTKNELLSMCFLDITHPDDIEKSKKKFESSIKDKSVERYTIEKRYVKKNGDIITGLMGYIFSRTDSGKCEFMMSQIKDLTKEKLLLSQVEKKSIELEAANKIFKVVSEISQFTINQEIFNLNDVFNIAGESLEMGCLFLQNCQESMDISKFWTPHNVEITETEISKMQSSTDISLISNWVSIGKLFIGKIEQAPLELSHLSLIEVIKKSNQVYVLPILMKQRPWGIMGFVNGNGHLWSEAEREALRSLGRLIVVMIENNWEKSKLIDHISFKFEEIENMIDGNVLEDIKEEVQQ